MPEKLYTKGEFAKIFSISYFAVKKWTYAGKIKYIKPLAGDMDTLRAGSERLLGDQTEEKSYKRKKCGGCKNALGDRSADCELQAAGSSSVHPESSPHEVERDEKSGERE